MHLACGNVIDRIEGQADEDEERLVRIELGIGRWPSRQLMAGGEQLVVCQNGQHLFRIAIDHLDRVN